jgi:hypothetical protein
MREVLEPRTFEHEPEHEAIVARGQCIRHFWADRDREESPVAERQFAGATNGPGDAVVSGVASLRSGACG